MCPLWKINKHIIVFCFFITLSSLSGLTFARDNLTYDDLSVEMPSYELLDYSENWSQIKGYSQRDLEIDPWLRYKYMPMKHYQGGWMSFGGEMRDRVERWENFNFIPDDNDTLNLWRILVHADLHFSDYVRLFVGVKSALASNPSVPDDVLGTYIDEFALQQLFLELHPLDDPTLFFIRIGRQEIAFPRYRLITLAPWSNVMRTWDGFSGIYENDNLKLTGWALQIVDVRESRRNPSFASDSLFGVYGNYKGLTLNYDFYWIFDHVKDLLFQGPTLTNLDERQLDNRSTVGFRVFEKDKTLNYDFEFAYQFGRWGIKSIDAFMLGASWSYGFEHYFLSPTLFWGYDYATGGKSNGDTLHTFYKLEQAGHLYLGFVDAIGRQNINSPNIGLSLKPKSDMLLSFAYHYFRRQNAYDAVYLPSGVILREGLTSRIKEIGNELDVYFTKEYSKHARLLLGYSFFKPGAFLNATAPSDTIQFYYAQLRYTV